MGTVQHTLEVDSVAISGSPSAKGNRRLALIDKNRDLYITPTEGAQEMVKLHTMVDTVNIQGAWALGWRFFSSFRLRALARID
jgi:hypothetical protein